VLRELPLIIRWSLVRVQPAPLTVQLRGDGGGLTDEIVDIEVTLPMYGHRQSPNPLVRDPASDKAFQLDA